jgi:hypothetical protein
VLLQIVTGKYFREVPLRETTHRRVLYTNADFLRRPSVWAAALMGAGAGCLSSF